MKLLSFLFAITALHAAAQTDEFERKLMKGFKLGMNYSLLVQEKNDVLTTGKKMGLNACFYVEVPLSYEFRIQPEVGYSEMGGSFTQAGITTTNKLSYFTINTIAKFGITNSGFGFFIGPQLSLLLGAKQHFGSTKKNNRGQYFPRDFSALGGIEYEFKNNFVLSVRYQYGLFDISKVMTNGTLKNDAVTFTAGFPF